MEKSRPLLVTVTVAGALASCLSSEPAEDPEPETEAIAHQRRVAIAWLNSDPANTYDAANLDGVQAVAAGGHASVTRFYSYFDPALQLAQCLDVVRRRRHDAIVIIPVDAVGILPCVRAAYLRGIPVVASDLPIGPAIDTVEPQVRGQAGAVLVPPATWGDTLAPLVLDLCASHTPCNVVYLAGSFDVANDQVALARLEAAAAAHPGLHLIADQAFYDRGLAASLTASILQQQPDVHVIIGAGDQMARGAEDAVAAAPPSTSVHIIGAGAGAYGIDAVRAGRWYATFVALPRDEGELSAQIALRAARCQHVPDRGIDPVQRRGLPSFFATDNQHLFGGFVPQWPG